MRLIDKESILAMTHLWEGDRFPDGRPRVPDDILQRMKAISIEQAWGVLNGNDYKFQFAMKLDLFVNGQGDLRFRDPVTGDELLTYDQEAAARRAAEARAEWETARADQETARRRAAEARIAEMERPVASVSG